MLQAFRPANLLKRDSIRVVFKVSLTEAYVKPYEVSQMKLFASSMIDI